ncbi:MAG: ABC transporter permease [Acidobacteriota bacterium]|nr:ABC transporter permease [Acidobacteriota bacterium]
MLITRIVHALRMLRKNPGFTLLAILILGLGIGANTAIFSLVDSVLLRPLAYRDSSRLVMLWQSVPSRGLSQIPVSQADFTDYAARSASFERLAAIYLDKEEYAVTGSGTPEQVRGMAVSTNLFALLGVAPGLGRDFLPDEGHPGNERTVIVSHGFWQRHFGGDPSALGRELIVDGNPRKVVGIMPRGFAFPPPLSFGIGSVPGGRDLWVPVVLNTANRDYHPLGVVGRLRSGVSLERARAEVSAIASALAAEYARTNNGLGTSVSPMLEQVVHGARPALLLLLAGVGCVMLIACVNIANLLLARSIVRRKELAVRAALGANRRELIKQILSENMILGLLGGAAGVLLAAWGVDVFRSLADVDIPRLAELHVDWRMFAFGMSLSLLTGLLTGLLPALTASRMDLNEALKEAGRTLASPGHNGIRGALAVAEIGIAIVLLVAAGLLIRSFDRLLRVPPGFQTANLLTLQLRLPQSSYPDTKIAEFETQLLERIAKLPGVVSSAAVNSLPITGFQGSTLFRIEGRLAPHSISQSPMGGQRVVSPAYFRTMGIPLKDGREFSEYDNLHATRVAIVSQSIADRYFSGENPVGRRIQLENAQGPWLNIVGVAGDVHSSGLLAGPAPEFYVPYTQDPWSVMAVVIRTRAHPEALASLVRDQVWSIDHDLPVAHMATMEDNLTASLAGRRFQLIVLGAFAGIALVLALVGIYGVISYTVSHRAHDIAIRMALGARPIEVLRKVLLQGLTLACAGIVAGLVAAVAVTRWMEGLLFQIHPADPATLAAVSVAVLITALLACYLPARRATRIDPVAALRE